MLDGVSGLDGRAPVVTAQPRGGHPGDDRRVQVAESRAGPGADGAVGIGQPAGQCGQDGLVAGVLPGHGRAGRRTLRRPGGQARSGLELGLEVVLADERAQPVDGPARGQEPDGAQPEAGRPPEPLGDTLRSRLGKEASKGRPFTAVGRRLEGPDRP